MYKVYQVGKIYGDEGDIRLFKVFSSVKVLTLPEK